MSIIDRLLGRKPADKSASLAKERLSILVSNTGCSQLARELEARLRETVKEFYREKKLDAEMDFDEIYHQLSDENVMEVSIPLPEKN
ncbi:putative Cell division topological specificity factor [Vibrio chagasii]|nr:putative Cell division topological specificity factor [Vibrio chagasii]